MLALMLDFRKQPPSNLLLYLTLIDIFCDVATRRQTPPNRLKIRLDITWNGQS